MTKGYEGRNSWRGGGNTLNVQAKVRKQHVARSGRTKGTHTSKAHWRGQLLVGSAAKARPVATLCSSTSVTTWRVFSADAKILPRQGLMENTSITLAEISSASKSASRKRLSSNTAGSNGNVRAFTQNVCKSQATLENARRRCRQPWRTTLRAGPSGASRKAWVPALVAL